MYSSKNHLLDILKMFGKIHTKINLIRTVGTEFNIMDYLFQLFSQWYH